MSNETTDNACTEEDRVLWVHTGIEAPYKFTSINYSELTTPRGVAFTADLVHPQHGVVGQIHNSGVGGPTTFDSYDRARFSENDLQRFAQRCLQDGEPIGAGWVENLLDDILDETDTNHVVRTARSRHGAAIRTFTPKAPGTHHGPYRGGAMPYDQIIVRRSVRKQLADELANSPAHRPHDPSAFWQLFSGEDWIDLLGPAPLSAEAFAARFDALDRVAESAPDTLLNRQQIHIDGVTHCVTGDPAGEFWLLADKKNVGRLDVWCWCPPQRRARTTPFEVWNARVLQATGLLHADSDCRCLVRID